MRQNKLTVTISSVTGNTEKIARAVLRELDSMGVSVSVFKNRDMEEIPAGNGPLLMFFWCRRSGMDDLSLNVLEKCQGRTVLAIGTMGSYPDGAYGQRVYEKVNAQVKEQNFCAGVFLSQGKISEKRTEYRRNLPIGHPHRLDERGLARHLESRKHPDEQDIWKAVSYVKSNLSSLLESGIY